MGPLHLRPALRKGCHVQIQESELQYLELVPFLEIHHQYTYCSAQRAAQRSAKEINFDVSANKSYQ